MQQAVVSSSQIPPVTTASIALLSLNRHLIQQKISEIINNLSKYIRADTAATISTDSKQSVHTTSNKQNNLQTRQLLTDLLNRQTTVILDSILNSLNNITKKEAKNVTFFQNRHGFTADELLNCEFNEASTKRFNLNSILTKTNRNPTNFLILHNQIRGFKTKRTTQQEDIESKKDIFSDYFNKKAEKTNPAKIINSILTQSRNKNLGSILQSTNANLDADSKVKIAFAEGVLYAKHEDKKPNPSSFLRFLFFVSLIILFTALFPISFSSSSNGGSNTGGGINIRALTGSVNYEVNPEQVTVKFDDVKGLTEAKKELSEIVDFLKEPEKYSKLGARLPKGILLIGPPGCGKTLLAKSVAGEAGVPYFQASGSDFDEMFVGTGSKRVRQLFAAARAKAPCVIFIDEIDSVGSTRTNSAIHPHANQTINQLLAEMDGFQKNEGVIVLGATNRRETLDSALMRPGRFDVEVRIDKPDLKQRIEILDYYLDKVARDDDIDVKYLAKQLNGLSASAIENVVNQAALRAVITDGKSVKMQHLEWALDRALMGYGKERIADEECNRNTAYHEAGHVLVAYYTKDSHPLHKVTILPRTQSLGHTAFVPEDEGYSMTKSQLLAQMDVAMGGRVAEEFAFGTEKVTTGASGDFKKATQIAVSMIKMFGMNDKVGIRVYEGDKNSEDLSPQTQEILDQEIKKTLNDSYERAKNIIKTHSIELKLIADALLKHETLDVDQIKKIIDQKVLI